MSGETGATEDPTIARWDERYRESLADWPDEREPHAFLAAHADLLPESGTALDVAAGLGRNSVWLARRGLRVTAVDGSAVACAHLSQRAAKLAQTEGLEIAVVCADLEREALPSGLFDVVVCTLYLQRSLAGAIVEALAPRGVLVFSTYLEAGVEGRAARRYGLKRGELAAMFPGLETLVYEEDGDEVERPSASLLGRKPG